MASLKVGRIYFTRSKDDDLDIYMFIVKGKLYINYSSMKHLAQYGCVVYSFTSKEWYEIDEIGLMHTENYIEMGEKKRQAIKDLFLYEDAFRK